jgi:hypothetical protein
MKRINSLLVVAVVVFFSTLFVSCGNSRAISMVRTGYLDIDPERTIDEVFKAYPERVGSIKWKVEEVIKQSKKEGGNVCIVSATLKHDTSIEALFTDNYGEVIDNPMFNAYMTHLLYDHHFKIEESDITKERCLAIIDKVAKMYIDNTYEYTSRWRYNSYGVVWSDEDLPRLFNIDSVEIIALFAAMPKSNYFELINFRYEFKISTNLLEKKDSFTITVEPDEHSIYDIVSTFRALFYEGGKFGDTMYDKEYIPLIRNEVLEEYEKIWIAMDNERMAEEDRIKQEEKNTKIRQSEEQFKQDQKIAISKIDQRIEYFKSFIPENTPQEKIKELFIEPAPGYKIPISDTIEDLEMSKARINQSPTKFDEHRSTHI